MHQGDRQIKMDLAMVKPKFLTSSEFADRIGKSRASAWRFLRRHPGIAINIGGQYRVPVDHLNRLLAGEAAEAIAAKARSIGDTQTA